MLWILWSSAANGAWLTTSNIGYAAGSARPGVRSEGDALVYSKYGIRDRFQPRPVWQRFYIAPAIYDEFCTQDSFASNSSRIVTKVPVQFTASSTESEPPGTWGDTISINDK
jgi:hypothetical protein